MPLQVATRALNLPDPVIRANRRPWIFAETVNLGAVTLLLLWRSVVVRDTDPVFDAIRDLMGRHTVETVIEERLEDPDIMHGIGIAGVYLLHPAEGLVVITDPDVRTFLSMFDSWGEVVPMHTLPDKIRLQLQLVRS